MWRCSIRNKETMLPRNRCTGGRLLFTRRLSGRTVPVLRLHWEAWRRCYEKGDRIRRQKKWNSVPGPFRASTDSAFPPCNGRSVQVVIAVEETSESGRDETRACIQPRSGDRV